MLSQVRRGIAKPIILFAIAIAAASVAIWLWSRPATRPALDAGRRVAETFLQEIHDGRPEQAWESTTAEFKSAQGKERFVREVKLAKFLRTPLEFIAVQDVMIQQQPRAEYSFRAQTGEIVRVVLGRDGSNWKVDRWARP